MVLTLNLPDEYPYVLLATIIAPFITSFVMGGKVMSARKKFNVQYPNLYATVGYHKEADEFNRVQRGHQSMMESAPSVMAMGLVAGTQYPLPVVGLSLAYCAGNFFFLVGYSDTSKDVKMARYSGAYGLGALKPLGMLGLLVLTCVTIAGMLRSTA